MVPASMMPMMPATASSGRGVPWSDEVAIVAIAASAAGTRAYRLYSHRRADAGRQLNWREGKAFGPGTSGPEAALGAGDGARGAAKGRGPPPHAGGEPKTAWAERPLRAGWIKRRQL